MKGYSISIYSSEHDGGFIADIPDLKLCSASGATPEKALQQVLRAKETWLEITRAKGRPIPPARYRPLIFQVS
jgi:predicted RNase H-like HicB family nuclease